MAYKLAWRAGTSFDNDNLLEILNDETGVLAVVAERNLKTYPLS